MVSGFAKKIFGSRNDRMIKRFRKSVETINAFEDEFQKLSDDALRAKTPAFRERLEKGEVLDDLLPEAFATVREASRRVLNMRHYDVQMIGGMILNSGRITEMRTGEGKTLVATVAAYLNALSGEGVHVVTVNDYLAARDSAWMGKLYEFLGLTTGVITSGLDQAARQQAYAADITYGTNNEFGFDYLRDNMAFHAEQRVQRGLNFCIIDEVDSVLIDEARTPLIISGPTNDSSDLYTKINALVPLLERQEPQEEEGEPEEEGPGDYSVDEKSKQVYLTEAGHERVEAMMLEQGLLQEGDSLYDPNNITLMHHLNAALRAHTLYHKDDEYIVSGDQIVIVDEFTGRTMPGRRWGDGLHQAVEAKEGVSIQRENQTLASITFQNFFRQYAKLSGMTGTADTEAFEFKTIYDLEVLVVPTNRPMVRKDADDLVYLSVPEKYAAIVKDIEYCVEHGRPVLVGTTSIENSEYISKHLKKSKIPHEILNAKQHEREAHIIAQAGRPGAVTIATNMAGRGTDIVLGGSLEAELESFGNKLTDEKKQKLTEDWQKRHDAVLASGGLHIIGTERHESRRIDNQLRGRAGRQGDAGSSRFYLSLEDSLLRIFASDKVRGLMQRLGMEEGEAIENKWVTKSIENAQRKVEAHNFDIRKHLLDYDDVANDQRGVVYEQRRDLLEADDIADTIANVRDDVLASAMAGYIPPGSIDEQWDIPGLTEFLEKDFGMTLDIQGWLDADDSLHEESLRDKIIEACAAAYAAKEAEIDSELMRRLEKDVMLQVLDAQWKEHLAAMDYLRQSIGLRGYAQKNPKQEYKREAFEMFEAMLERLKHDVIGFLMRVQFQSEDAVAEMERRQEELAEDQQRAMEFKHAQAENALGGASSPELKPQTHQPFRQEAEQKPFRRETEKVGRNDPCPCGSGKKYKHCHGKIA